MTRFVVTSPDLTNVLAEVGPRLRQARLRRDVTLTELAALQTQTGAAALGGALSLGEIGSTSTWGYPMFHNATLVCTPWHRA